jgi:hypothetical protein
MPTTGSLQNHLFCGLRSNLESRGPRGKRKKLKGGKRKERQRQRERERAEKIKKERKKQN